MKEEFTKVIAILGLCALSMVVGIGVMFYGYGVAPVSLGWIIGGTLIQSILIPIVQSIGKK